MSEANKRVVLEYVDAFNRGDLDALCGCFGPGALVYGVLGWGEIEKVKAIWHDIIHCFAINLQVESMIGEGDTVAVRYVGAASRLVRFAAAR